VPDEAQLIRDISSHDNPSSLINIFDIQSVMKLMLSNFSVFYCLVLSEN